MNRKSVKSAAWVCCKALLTFAIFYLLLTHPVRVDGERLTVWETMTSRAHTLTWEHAGPYLLMAMACKAVGIFAAMIRWHGLLLGQGIRFPFGHTAQSFLIGRFLGTFLPGTLGLDGYKLYDAKRYGHNTYGAIAATVVEKLLGLAGILLTFLLAAPFGYHLLGSQAQTAMAVCAPLACVGLITMLLILAHPTALRRILLTRFSRQGWVQRLGHAIVAYQGAMRPLVWGLLLSFVVHATTATLYFFTALAVGAQNTHFGEVVFASSIQIFVTATSPLTLAGEGVREVTQALLLAKRIGMSESIMSAALGFWAAEALTLVGGYFWWRRSTYELPTAPNMQP